MNPKEQLQKMFWDFHEAHPGMEVRDIANDLDVPEAVLVSSFLGEGAVALQVKPKEMIHHLLQSGLAFTSHTRMPHSEIETQMTSSATLAKGEPGEIILQQSNAKILFLISAWAHAFFLEEETNDGWVKSIQFFDGDGTSTLKLFLQDIASEKIEQMKNAFLDETAVFLENIGPLRSPPTFRFNKEIHTAVTPFTCSGILNQCLEKTLSLQMTLRNPGTIHEHRGSLNQVFKRGPWIHALGPGLSLKVRFNQFGSAYIVKKNQRLDLEYYDKTGEFMVGFSCDDPTADNDWNDLLKHIPR